ncbi:MAG: hypothetical protein NTY19_23360 [Planctomycetota bacterium]|nr:hypothetical protein [Planctomycetota bacterium]
MNCLLAFAAVAAIGCLGYLAGGARPIKISPCRLNLSRRLAHDRPPRRRSPRPS